MLVGGIPLFLGGAGLRLARAIFGFGNGAGTTAVTNLVSDTGVVATDTAGVGTARYSLAGAGYGGDKAIFGIGGSGYVTNLVSNTGVVAANVSGVGTDRRGYAGAGYGGDKAIFGQGTYSSSIVIANLVSNTGVVATDTTSVGTARWFLAAAGYGADKAIFGYGTTTNSSANVSSITNLVSDTGVIATDTISNGTARYNLAAASFG